MSNACDKCGHDDGVHEWVEGDCVLQHRIHSRRLIKGTAVCEPCVKRHDAWLEEILNLYATLTGVIYVDDVQAEQTEYQKPRKKPASPSPLRLAAWALMHPEQLNSHIRLPDGSMESAYLGANLPDVPDVMTNWAQACYDEQGWTYTAPATVSGAVAALRANKNVMAGLADVDTYDAEIAWVRTALRAAHGVTSAKPVGRCPSLDGWGKECGGPLWPNETGRMSVHCGKCERSYDERFLSHLGGMLSA